MAWFEDLSPCTAFPGEWSNLLAVGWLAKSHEYTRGAFSRELIRALGEVNPWEPPAAPTATHRCDMCAPESPIRSESGAHFIPGDGVLYVAPRMISHYMREHGYVPPPSFTKALLACRLVEEATYHAAIARHLAVPRRSLPAPVRGEGLMILEGIEPVRLRPGMYIGGTDARGLENMLFEFVGNSLDQHLAGSATRLSIGVDSDGWVTVEDDGAGIPTEVLPSYGSSVLELIFTTLHATPTFDGHFPHVHARVGLHGAGVGVGSALSERLEVETCSAGHVFRAAFERGRIVEPLRLLGSTPGQGTRIRYLPDDVIFAGGHDLEPIERRLRQLAGLCPGLALSFQGKSLQRPEGLSGWVRELAPDAVKETLLFASGTHDEVSVEAAFAWSPTGQEPRILSFVNCSETPRAGSHERGLLAAVSAVPPNPEASKRLLEGFVAVVHVQMSGPKFEGPTKTRLDAMPAQIAVNEVVKSALLAAPWWWDRLHEAIG